MINEFDADLFVFLQIGIYIVLIPIVWITLMSVDLAKIFKKYHTAQIRMAYILITITLAKIVGDFLIMIIRFSQSLI